MDLGVARDARFMRDIDIDIHPTIARVFIPFSL